MDIHVEEVSEGKTQEGSDLLLEVTLHLPGQSLHALRVHSAAVST